MDALKDLTPIRCNNCGKKLAEAKIKEGIVSIKCKCGSVNILEKKITPNGKTISG